MVDELIPMAVQRKLTFETHPPLIDDYEAAACIGLAAKKAGVPLPEGELLSEVQKEFTARPEVPEEYKRLLASYPSPDHRSDWRRLMLAGYEYQG